MKNKEIKELLELQRHFSLVKKDGPDKGKDLFNWVLSGVYHKPNLTTAEVFTKILLHWVAPPAKVLDPTAGPRVMYYNLHTSHGCLDCDKFPHYDFSFGDINPQSKDIIKMDATHLPEEYRRSKPFEAVVLDFPYRKNLSGEKKRRVRNYKGDPEFDLEKAFINVAFEFKQILNLGGKVIVKIGDNHRKNKNQTIFETWHIAAVQIFSLQNFRFVDQVIFQPWYEPRFAPRRRISMQRHSYFMLFEKI